MNLFSSNSSAGMQNTNENNQWRSDEAVFCVQHYYVVDQVPMALWLAACGLLVAPSIKRIIKHKAIIFSHNYCWLHTLLCSRAESNYEPNNQTIIIWSQIVQYRRLAAEEILSTYRILEILVDNRLPSAPSVWSTSMIAGSLIFNTKIIIHNIIL